MNDRYKSHKKAFSLFELSIVVLIVGLLIGSLVTTSIIITKARISTAVTLTSSSPVNSIPNLTLWVEASDESNFLDNETDIGRSISAWHDKNKSNVIKNNATQATSVNQPTYSNAINNIYSIKFDGTDDFLSINGSTLNNTDYTIFVVDKRLSNKTDNYFIGDAAVTTTNQTLVLGYSTNTGVIHSQGTSNSYTSSISEYTGDRNEPKIFSFLHNSNVGKKTYINGMLAAQSNDTSNLTNVSTLKVGNAYNGEIGEIIIFDRALKDEEKNSVETYLSKKWQIKNYIGTICTTGYVNYQGCNIDTCSVAVTGSSTTSVSSGASGSLSCDATGYNGSISYACNNGSLSTTGSCACGSGYTSSGGTCQANCSVSGITGVTSAAVSGSGSLTCNNSNFTGSVSYTCSSGTLSTSGTCACASGYTLSGSTCGATTCSFSGTAGVDDGTTVNYTTSTLTQACNASGYSGTVSYTCTAAGAPSVSGNNCSLPNYHWTLVTNSACDARAASGQDTSTAVCNASNVGKYIWIDGTSYVPSSLTITGRPPLYAWVGAYSSLGTRTVLVSGTYCPLCYGSGNQIYRCDS